MIPVPLRETLPAFVPGDPRTLKRVFEHLVCFRLQKPMQDVVLALILQSRDHPQELIRFRQDFDLDQALHASTDRLQEEIHKEMRALPRSAQPTTSAGRGPGGRGTKSPLVTLAALRLVRLSARPEKPYQRRECGWSL
jgi:hypothetical protein